MKTLTLKEKKLLDKLKKDFPIGTYTKKDSYSVKIVGHSIIKAGGRESVLTKLQFVNNPNYGNSFWYNDLTNLKRLLKGYTLKK